MPAPLSSMRAAPVRWGAAAVVLVGAAGLGLRALLPTAVTVTSLQRQDVVRTLVLVGRVRAPSRSRLGASVSGTVQEVRVREGDRVEAGQLLVSLDDREARARVAEAEAALSEVTASVRATVEQAEQEATLAQRDLERLQAVAREGGLTRQRVEQAEQRAADARSRLDAARAQAGPDGDGRGIATVERARAALDGARARLALTRVEAPAAGTVLLRDVEPGDAAQPGRTLLEVALDGPTEIVVFPAEENLGGIQVGALATASADAYPDESFPARVALVAPSVDAAQGTVEVRLLAEAPPPYLLPDMTLSVNIEAGRRPGAAVLPEDAVRGLGTPEPWVAVVRDGRLERRDVEVGLRAGAWVEILSGLGEGEPVVPAAGSPEMGTRVRVRPTAAGR
ncbi:MAG TPA: efflux RND transporter periplasmic adaptor subunit [Longimicrobiales bacterium]|nr:efflux RND transporter periplasmic adaptor subunit [Longimicrobiales bacterium]